VNNPAWLEQGYMHIKLILVVFLYAYHFSMQVLLNQLQRDSVKYSSQQMRLWNEVATLFLISIVFLIVLKTALSMLWGLAGLVLITALIMAGIRWYKKYRK
jgi:putative membrane protein